MFALAIILFFFSGCEKAFDVKKPPDDPIAVFDELWNFMDSHYSMFSFKGVDWKEVYKQYRPQVKEGMTDKSLFNLLQSMLETLKDGHVALISAFDTAVYENFYRPFPLNFNYPNLINNYLRNDYKTSGPVIFKTVTNIGYLYYGSFRIDISDEQVNTIFNEVSSTKGLIIDIRNNSGGKSDNVNKLFSRFIASKKLVKYELLKKGNGHDDFFDPTPYYVTPMGQYYKNSIVVLTNRQCFSVCNDFVSYMSEIPNVKIMGDRTGGGGGLPQNYILANGWKLQYTATVTLSSSKVNIENGIPPTLNIGITQQDINNGKDIILETAFQSLR